MRRRSSSAGTQGKDRHDSPPEWLLIADDDTLVNFVELRRILANYDPSVPLLIGDRYAYGHGMGRGYDYLVTGGAGTVLSSQALQMIVEKREVDGDACGARPESTDKPDDMWLGQCAQSLGIPLVNEPGFHQARPSDYNTATISLHPPVSFHRFKDMNEALEISRLHLGGHFDTGR
jgi:UDP-glucose:O-linked fucose beta-1,3-glucosyltransferase